MDSDKQTDELIGSMPEPQPHAIAAEQERETAQRAEWADLTDSKGQRFDPDIHQTDSVGAPLITPGGKLKRRPGRKKSTLNKPTASTQNPGQSGVQADAPPDYHGAAVGTVESIGLLTQMLGGPEWAYAKSDRYNIDERQHGIEAFERYYAARGIADIPPGITVALWGIAYAAPRFAMPKTRGRLQKAKDWIAIKILRRRIEKAPEEKPVKKAGEK